MNNRRIFLSGFAAIAGLALTGCEKLKQAGEAAKILASQGKGGKRWPNYRYRLTVQVETPEGLKTGSSVIEVRTAMGGPNDIPSPGSLYADARGEAVVIDLGERGMLFALLRSEKHEEWAAEALHSVFPRLTREERGKLRDDEDEVTPRMERLFKLPLDKPVLLPRQVETNLYKNYKPVLEDNYPLLVRFDDTSKPETVKRVDPDDLSTSFGGGVTMKSITIARTEAVMTKGIEQRLAWLGRVGRKRATLIPNPPRYLKDVKDTAIQLLSPSAFSSELYE